MNAHKPEKGHLNNVLNDLIEIATKPKKPLSLSINIDLSEATDQANQILKLLKLPASTFENIHEDVINMFFRKIQSLVNDISLKDFSAAFSTTDTNEILLKIKIVGPLDRLASAVRAGELESFILNFDKKHLI